MASNPNPTFAPEIGPDGLARESPFIAYTERIIEAEQLQLRKYIEENYSKIRDVERELANLNMEMKLTAGPKKAALEHMRKKIEISTEKIRVAKLKEEQAKQAWEAASKAVKDEEAIKQKLCEDLNSLVTESNNAQHARLDELKRRLEAMNPSRSSAVSPSEKDSTPPAQDTVTQTASEGPVAQEAANRNPAIQRNAGDVTEANNSSQQPSLDASGRAKKKNMIQGRGKGLGAVPKGRGSAAPGWTGAGFDVDGQS
ncbi:hypothetical protein LIER_32409 [Lithospermum erythrorhizon]|uniref:RAB6-interacting golgin n=1 Tax=Lithospermum erythrorhizon TaxID=34254 RepID=A0AAV3RTR8_LITER